MPESQPSIGRWVVVDDGQTIVGGPYLWDGQAEWQPPERGELLREDEALDLGYTYREL